VAEDGRHRLDRSEVLGDGFEVGGSEHPGSLGSLVGVVVDGIPPPEDEVVERGEGDEVGDTGIAVFCPLTEANVSELGQRPNRVGDTVTGREDASVERGRHRAHAGGEHAEGADRGADVVEAHRDSLRDGWTLRLPLPMTACVGRCGVSMMHPGDGGGKPRRVPQIPATSSGRIGARVRSRPVAARMAATTAAVDETVGGSPIPLAPNGPQ